MFVLVMEICTEFVTKLEKWRSILKAVWTMDCYNESGRDREISVPNTSAGGALFTRYEVYNRASLPWFPGCTDAPAVLVDETLETELL